MKINKLLAAVLVAAFAMPVWPSPHRLRLAPRR
jgi:hypothetical protein